MFTTTIGLSGQASASVHVPAKATRAATLPGALLLVSVAVNGLIMAADGYLRQPAPTLEFAR